MFKNGPFMSVFQYLAPSVQRKDQIYPERVDCGVSSGRVVLGATEVGERTLGSMWWERESPKRGKPTVNVYITQ